LKLVKKKETKKSNVVQIKESDASDGKVVDLMEVLKRTLAGKSK